MQVVIDIIKSKLITNWKLGKPTYIKVDEVGKVLSEAWLFDAFDKFYTGVRKYNGYITGIIQNVNKLYRNEKAIGMLSNSEIIVMLRQSDTDAQLLKQIFNLSPLQVDQLERAEPGCGIIKCGNGIFGYDGRIEQSGPIYELVNTKQEFQMYGEN